MTFKETLALLGKQPAFTEAEHVFLRRWQEDPLAESNWNKIVARAKKQEDEEIDSVDFVLFVLNAKDAADKVNQKTRLLVERQGENKKLVGKAQRRFGKHVAAGKVAPEDMPVIQKRLQQAASEGMNAPLVRSDDHGSRARTLFMRDVSNLIHDLTGYRMDEQVAALTSIAFNCKVDAESVRSANRETSRRLRRASWAERQIGRLGRKPAPR